MDTLEAFQGSWAAFLDIDMQFHRILYGAAGSQRWLDTSEALWRRRRRPAQRPPRDLPRLLCKGCTGRGGGDPRPPETVRRRLLRD
jgi:hypothetical protein